MWAESFFSAGLNGCVERASSLPGYQESGYTPSEAYASCLRNVQISAHILASAAAVAMAAGVIALAVYVTREYLSGRCINLTTGYVVKPQAFNRVLRWCGYVAMAMLAVYAMILFPVG